MLVYSSLQRSLIKSFSHSLPRNQQGKVQGMGLSLSYDIIKAHGGEIKIDTKEARLPARMTRSDGNDKVGQGEGSRVYNSIANHLNWLWDAQDLCEKILSHKSYKSWFRQ